MVDTWSHNYSELLRLSVVMHDGFHLLIPVRSDSVGEHRRIRRIVVHCEHLFHFLGRSTFRMLIYVLIPD